MNKLSKEEIKSLVIVAVVLLVILSLVATVVRFLWPVLLIAAIYFGWKYWKAKKEGRVFTITNSFSAEDLGNQLFREQVKRKKESGDIIDAEFTEHKTGNEREMK
ncbi:MAG: hypothetical protein IJ120_00560 [Solobacterium sp.]|nr:hypothetical protein [Solobacterium sp.]